MDIGGWLRSLGLEKYEAAFRENDVDETVLPGLTHETLKELGVASVGHRVKLLDAIAALRRDMSAPGPSSDLKTTASAPSAPAEDRAERRQVTVMFSDLVGSTALSARMDPEDLREVISAYQKCVAETVQHFGGFVAKYMGDGVLIYFGYPHAHEDDAERAVRAGLELVAAVSALKTNAPLQTRVGIATGLVVVGDLIGSGVSQEQAIVGETPNLAARLQGIAGPNTVVIAESARKLLGNLFELDDLGAMELKGIAGSVRAWTALRASSVESHFEAQHETKLTPLVGRDEELELLLRRWRQAVGGEGRVVLLSGEPGIGKSRLTVALEQQLQTEQYTPLRFFCSPLHTDSTLYPFISQLERAAGFQRNDTMESKLDKLSSLLGASPNHDNDVQLLAELLSVPTGDRYPPLNLSARQKKRKTIEALVRQLEVLVRQRPVLMIFEDAHRIDPSSRELLDTTIERVARLPVLLVITFRSEFHPPWTGQAHVTTLNLSRLGRREGAALAGSVAGNNVLPEEIVEEIIERTDGIPLFVEELTKAVVEARVRDGDEVFAEALRSSPYFRPGPKNPVRRMMETKAVVHVVDNAATEAYVEREPIAVASVELGGTRTLMVVPMLNDNELVGAFTLARQEVRPFTDKQIELVKNFAAQAVIAIENARLLNELRQRTTDLTEALEQQTATSEVLRVISSSPADLRPVFEAMLDHAVRIWDVMGGSICRRDGNALHHVAVRWVNPVFAELLMRTPIHPNPKTNVGRMLATKKAVHVPDLAAQPAYIEQREPGIVAAVEIGRVRTALYVPMLKEDELIGAILLARGEVRPFTDKQIELVQNFAAQAIIAIENARLLNELRQSLEQQTATAQVLQVISSSTSDLARVFATMLENATRICEAKFGTLYLKEGDGFRATATHNAPPAYEEARAQVVHPSPHTTLWQAANTKRPVQIVDVTLEQGYSEGDPFVLSAVKLGGYRSVLSVPLLHEVEVVGVISIFRQDVSSFNDKHVSLLQNFAAQAVIAIENARLLSDLQESTQELSALNEQLEHRVADQVGEIERMGRLRRFLPPQVADLIVASGSEKQLESHRREITALFCDLRGFTGFTESADAEDVMALLRDYHAAIGEAIIKYSGTLERYAGDGVMVIFNDPVPVENPALQAVLMALEVRDAIGALTETWRRWGHDIGFGIGIAHGFATLGTIGFEGRFDYAAIGTVSNVASRLCDEAKPGQILISPRVLTKVENAVKVEPVGEFELKGIRRPLAAYNVVAATFTS